MARTPENNTDAYIEQCPAEVRPKLQEIRAAIREIAPDALERTDYFQIPGYSYEGYDYNGMFAWFSFQKGRIRLHLRPPVIEQHPSELSHAKTTKGIASFAVDDAPGRTTVQMLVRASLDVMRSPTAN